MRNSEVKKYLETQCRKGPLAQHPEYKSFPIKGVYMIQGMGPAMLLDWSYISHWSPENGTFDLALTDLGTQSGVPDAPLGGVGPYLPGGWALEVYKALDVNVRFSCPRRMQDGKSCRLQVRALGFSLGRSRAVWLMTPSEGGRRLVRDYWLAPPWQINDEEFRRSNAPLHSYSMIRLVDEHCTIDEEVYRDFMQKLNGQDLLFAAESRVSV